MSLIFTFVFVSHQRTSTLLPFYRERRVSLFFTFLYLSAAPSLMAPEGAVLIVATAATL